VIERLDLVAEVDRFALDDDTGVASQRKRSDAGPMIAALSNG
jgi:hypothetical protein